jgi:hypothetical protein
VFRVYVRNAMMTHKKKRKQVVTPNIKTTEKGNWLKSGWTVFVGIATIVGLVVALLAFLPRVTVTPSDPVNSSNPFSAAFTIQDTGVVTLNDVSTYVGLGQILTNGAKVDQIVPTFGSRLTMTPAWQNHTLPMDATLTITPMDVFVRIPAFPVRQTTFADIAVVIKYKPWIMPFHREKVFRFVTIRKLTAICTGTPKR